MRALSACRTLTAVALLGRSVTPLAAGTGIVYVDSSSGVQTSDGGGEATFTLSPPVAAGGVGNHLVVSLAAQGSAATIASVTYDQMAMTRLVSKVTMGDACRVELWELALATPDGLAHDVVVRTSAAGVVLAATSAQYRGVHARVSPALIGAAAGTADPATVSAANGPGQFSVGAACNRGTGGSRVSTPVSPSDGFVAGVSFTSLSLGALWAESGVTASQSVSWTVTPTSQGWAAVIATLPGDPPPPADAGVETGVDGSAPLDSRPDAVSDPAMDASNQDGEVDDGPRSGGDAGPGAGGGDGRGADTDDGPPAGAGDGPPAGGDDARLPVDVAPSGAGAPAGDAGRGRRALDLRVGCACRTATAAPGAGSLFPAVAALALLRRHLRRRQGGRGAKVGPRGGGRA
jgi:MYXO-CTERM domain-containing protein